ncbi:MAG: hypothetical protein Q9194_003867 [Teloschistes cf. exilis]
MTGEVQPDAEDGGAGDFHHGQDALEGRPHEHNIGRAVCDVRGPGIQMRTNGGFGQSNGVINSVPYEDDRCLSSTIGRRHKLLDVFLLVARGATGSSLGRIKSNVYGDTLDGVDVVAAQDRDLNAHSLQLGYSGHRFGTYRIRQAEDGHEVRVERDAEESVYPVQNGLHARIGFDLNRMITPAANGPALDLAFDAVSSDCPDFHRPWQH